MKIRKFILFFLILLSSCFKNSTTYSIVIEGKEGTKISGAIHKYILNPKTGHFRDAETGKVYVEVEKISGVIPYKYTFTSSYECRREKIELQLEKINPPGALLVTCLVDNRAMYTLPLEGEQDRMLCRDLSGGGSFSCQ